MGRAHTKQKQNTPSTLNYKRYYIAHNHFLLNEHIKCIGHLCPIRTQLQQVRPPTKVPKRVVGLMGLPSSVFAFAFGRPFAFTFGVGSALAGTNSCEILLRPNTL
jgi:hypothetical protein